MNDLLNADLNSDPKAVPNANLSVFGRARATIDQSPLEAEELRRIDSYWRATLYLSVGMIYLRNNKVCVHLNQYNYHCLIKNIYMMRYFQIYSNS